MSTEDLEAYIDDVMKARYPQLSDSRMSTDAGLAVNTVHRIRQGMNVGPDKLLALAMKWGRDDDERREDYRELMVRAGYAPPALEPVSDNTHGSTQPYSLTPFELQMVQIVNSLSDRAMTRARFLYDSTPPGSAVPILGIAATPTDEDYEAAAPNAQPVMVLPSDLATDREKETIHRARLMSVKQRAVIAAWMRQQDDLATSVNQFLESLSDNESERTVANATEAMPSESVEELVRDFEQLSPRYKRHILMQLKALKAAMKWNEQQARLADDNEATSGA